MFVEGCNKLGFLYKAYGIKGELIVRTDLNLSENTINKWESIFIEINGILVPFFIEQISRRTDIELQIKLEDIDDEIQAKTYIGNSIFIEKDNLQIEVEDEAFSQWVSFQIVDEQGIFIGQIVKLIEYPSQSMLLINTKEQDEILIPAIEEWIISVDSDKKEIVMNLPTGLIDLNLSTENLF